VTPEDAWIILCDHVIEITDWISEHPGGENILEANLGKDATPAFEYLGHSDTALHIASQKIVGRTSRFVLKFPTNHEGLSEFLKKRKLVKKIVKKQEDFIKKEPPILKAPTITNAVSSTTNTPKEFAINNNTGTINSTGTNNTCTITTTSTTKATTVATPTTKPNHSFFTNSSLSFLGIIGGFCLYLFLFRKTTFSGIYYYYRR